MKNGGDFKGLGMNGEIVCIFVYMREILKGCECVCVALDCVFLGIIVTENLF